MSAPKSSPRAFIGRYRIEAKLGEGGMGEVYRASDPRLGRTVAIKVLPARFVSEPDRLERFEREARAASALNHPNIVTVYDASVEDGVPRIAMECVEGRTLRAAQAAPGFSLGEALPIAVQIAEGLATAHEASIVHRDLKPENVMVTGSGMVKILDFGLAKLASPDAPIPGTVDETQLLTAAGRVMGTPTYMSPEQVSGRPVDHRSDQFAFGVVLYEMITGGNPFQRPTPAQTMAAIIESDPKPLGSLRPGVPAELSEIVSRCLAKEPAQRYGSTMDWPPH